MRVAVLDLVARDVSSGARNTQVRLRDAIARELAAYHELRLVERAEAVAFLGERAPDEAVTAIADLVIIGSFAELGGRLQADAGVLEVSNGFLHHDRVASLKEDEVPGFAASVAADAARAAAEVEKEGCTRSRASIMPKRPVVAVFPLHYDGPEGWGEVIANTISADLLRLDIVDLVERAELQAVLAETARQGALPFEDTSRLRSRLKRARFMIFGSVFRRPGGPVQANVRLAEAATGRVLWTKTLEGSASALFGHTSLVNPELLQALEAPALEPQLAARRRNEAKIFLERSRLFENYKRSDSASRPAKLEGLRHLWTALYIDPDWPTLYSELLRRHELMGEYSAEDERLLEVLWSATRSTAAPAYLVEQGALLVPCAQALPYLERLSGMRLTPRGADNLVRCLQSEGRASEALSFVQRSSISLEPAWRLGHLYEDSGRQREAAEAYSKLREENAGLLKIPQRLRLLKKEPEALALLRKVEVGQQLFQWRRVRPDPALPHIRRLITMHGASETVGLTLEALASPLSDEYLFSHQKEPGDLALLHFLVTRAPASAALADSLLRAAQAGSGWSAELAFLEKTLSPDNPARGRYPFKRDPPRRSKPTRAETMTKYFQAAAALREGRRPYMPQPIFDFALESAWLAWKARHHNADGHFAVYRAQALECLRIFDEAERAYQAAIDACHSDCRNDAIAAQSSKDRLAQTHPSSADRSAESSRRLKIAESLFSEVEDSLNAGADQRLSERYFRRAGLAQDGHPHCDRPYISDSVDPTTDLWFKGREGALGITYGGPGYVVITSVRANSPAERAGLRTGDIVDNVDGVTMTTSRGTNWVEHLLSGPIDSTARVRLRRPSTNQEFTVDLKRAALGTPDRFRP